MVLYPMEHFSLPDSSCSAFKRGSFLRPSVWPHQGSEVAERLRAATSPISSVNLTFLRRYFFFLLKKKSNLVDGKLCIQWSSRRRGTLSVARLNEKQNWVWQIKSGAHLNRLIQGRDDNF